jgi:DNA-binding response OmpR family regulator
MDMREMSVDREPAMLVLLGSSGATSWMIDADRVTIGRDPSCVIVIDDRRVSRVHAEVRREGARYVLADNNSKNGTFLNGDRVTSPAAIQDGDTVQVALAAELLFVAPGATAPLVEASGPARLASLIVDREMREVRIGGKVLEPPLSAPQFRLLELLWANVGKVVSREVVVEAVWPGEQVNGISEEAIDAMVRRLRERLGGEGQQRIATLRGHGFRVEAAEGRR